MSDQLNQHLDFVSCMEMRMSVQRCQQEDKLEIGNAQKYVLQWKNGAYSEGGCVQEKASAS